MFEVRDVTTGYLRVPVLEDVSFNVGRRQITAVVGANGAGKSTLVKAAAGLLPIRQGDINLDGASLAKVPAHRRARMGLAVVTEEKDLFAGLSVADHLRLGGRNAAPPRR